MIHETSEKSAMYVDANRAQPGSGISSFSIERYDHASAFLKQDYSVVVDVGCNTGIGAPVLRAASRAAQLVGIEVVPERAEQARAHFDLVYESLATNLPFDDRSVDAVVCLEVIEHLTEEDGEKFIQEVRRVLKPSGRFILTTPNSQYIKLFIFRKSVLDDPSDLSQYSPGQLSKILEKHGFSIQRLESTGRVSRYLGRRKHGLRFFGSFMLVGSV
jgi:ubiquinone/menaquinone biosynthesis C-methylase UbiE